MSWGHLYETALCGPLAEQLVGAAAIAAGMRVLVGDGDSRILTRRVALTVGPSGSVTTVTESAAALPFRLREFDAAVSLLSPSSSAWLNQMARVADGAAAVVRSSRPPVPEELLAQAWQEVTGALPQGLRPPLLAMPPMGWTATPLRDVARFDGTEQLWMSLCDHLAIEAPGAALAAVKRRFAEALAAFEGADGTLRIPVEVTLLSFSRG